MGVFIVAELSANHNKDLNLAKESLHAIKEIGCDAIKLQTYCPEMMTLDLKNDIFKIKSNTIWDEKYLFELYKDAAMPLSWNAELFSEAKKINLTCFSSAFDKSGVDLLEELGNPIYKIASFEITDIPLIKYIATKNKPIILSSGIASDRELSEAVSAIKENGKGEITILHCVSAYPAKLSEMNLAQMPKLAKYGVKFGLSDHSAGSLVATLGVALGASVIEKHFILNHSIKTPDSAFSMDKSEFGEMVKLIREAEVALNFESSGNSESSANVVEKKGREFARSLFVIKDIKKGEIFSEENIKSLRPNRGLAPKFLETILGKMATRDLAFGKPLELDDFA